MTQTLGTRPGSRGEEDAGGDAQVDPRIQARRDLVAQERQTRRRRRLLVAGAVVAVAALAWGVTHSPLLAVHRVVATGTTHVPARTVEEVAGIHEGEHLLDVDEGHARARLLALPWVADARVDVSWQGTAHLRVTERTPVAAVVAGPHLWMLVDAKGRSLARVSVVRPSLMVVSGLAAVTPGHSYGAALAAPLEVIAHLHPGLRSRVAGIIAARDGSLTLRLRSGGVAWLCQPDDLTAKLDNLATLFAHVDDRDVKVVDMCIADSPTVTRVPTP
jgi:cell division protein FtsQ